MEDGATSDGKQCPPARIGRHVLQALILLESDPGRIRGECRLKDDAISGMSVCDDKSWRDHIAAGARVA